ncbi:esterase/lipase family protein [Nocardia terrae]|uniref:esterase/lipase family protein n=1 Tax=Nocardia terrae TaxID=2675851 RepID=UPI002E25BBED
MLVHGTWAGAFGAYSYMGPELAKAGYCVFTFNYGRADVAGAGLVQPGTGATGYIEDSAAQLAALVDRVLATTGAAQVDTIGHSQGGVVIRQYLKFNGGADTSNPADHKVAHVITYGATDHGTSLGHAGIQQLVGSPVLTRLNDGGDTVPGVDYTIVADQVVRGRPDVQEDRPGQRLGPLIRFHRLGSRTIVIAAPSPRHRHPRIPNPGRPMSSAIVDLAGGLAR